jgi:hypothetical protein
MGSPQQMSNQQLIDYLQDIETKASDLQQRAYRLRLYLEGVSTPSAQQGSGLSEKERARLVSKTRTPIFKRPQK